MGRGRQFAQSLGGDLVVFSDDEEAQAVNSHFSDFYNARNDPASVLEICDEFAVIVKNLPPQAMAGGTTSIGIEGTSDGWKWVETTSLSQDPLANLDIPPERATFRYVNSFLWSLGSSFYVQRNLGVSTKPSLVLLEIPGSHTVSELQAKRRLGSAG